MKWWTRYRLNSTTERLAELTFLIDYWAGMRRPNGDIPGDTAIDLAHWGQERARLLVRKARLERQLHEDDVVIEP